MWTNINGRWKKGRPNVNVGGTWKQSTAVWQNVKGTWHKMSFGFYGETKGGSLVFLDYPSIKQYRVHTQDEKTKGNVLLCTSNSDITGLDIILIYNDTPPYANYLFFLNIYLNKAATVIKDTLFTELKTGKDYQLMFSKQDNTKRYPLNLSIFNSKWSEEDNDQYLQLQASAYSAENVPRTHHEILNSFYNYLRSNYLNNTDIKITLEAK